MNFRIEKKDSFKIMGLSGYDHTECEPNDSLTPLWREFMDNYNPRLRNGDGALSYYSAPFWQVGAYFPSKEGQTKAIIGAEYKGTKLDDMTIETIPAATWAVFTIVSPSGIDYVPDAFARILTEWFPASQYERDESVPSLEVYPDGDASSNEYQWEIWMPIKNK